LPIIVVVIVIVIVVVRPPFLAAEFVRQREIMIW
jgi:hypothetical protein